MVGCDVPNGEHLLRSENLAFDIDVWYPSLAAHTFRSVFLPLTRKEASAVVSYYNFAMRHTQEPDTPFTLAVVETLNALEKRIDETIQKEFGTRGAFLRLCGRSPKDGEPTDPAARAKIWENYESVVQTMVEKEGLPNSGNTRAAAIARTTSWLRVANGADAMSLLLTSERVFSDMLDWMHYGEPEQIVLREWSDSFNMSTEFRCYVHQGTLVGISQYDPYAMHAFLQDTTIRNKIVRAVVAEWIIVKDCIETIDGSYCADFGVHVENGTAQFIELSPYRRCTGPALFAWHQEAQLNFSKRPDVCDDKIINALSVATQQDSVSKEALFRVRSQEIPRIGDVVECNWELQWSTARVDTPKPYRHVYTQAVPTTITLGSRIAGLFSSPSHLLFVYGTLKRKFHWHSKYMTGAELIGDATTEKPQSLVIGRCGVPYMIRILHGTDANAKPVQGELWRISDEMLLGMDEYEGVDKGHYTRNEIAVICSSTCFPRKAFCYFYAAGSSGIDAELLNAERIPEYTLEHQEKRYKPIHHIQVKQLQYLGEKATT